LEEYLLVPDVPELYCGRECEKELLLDLDIKRKRKNIYMFIQEIKILQGIQSSVLVLYCRMELIHILLANAMVPATRRSYKF